MSFHQSSASQTTALFHRRVISSRDSPIPRSPARYRPVRERVATWEGGKGTLLEEIFLQRDAIAGSDQGKSFRAFWDFLMSPARQEEFSALLQAVFALNEVKELAPDRRLMRIHYDWLQAGEVAQRTVARLSEQLRRYLDDQAWLENRRIMQLIRNVEKSALAVRDNAPAEIFMELNEPAPTIDLAMERPLFAPPFKPRFTGEAVADGDQALAADALFDQVFVDKTRLMAQIRWALQTRHQISLADLVEQEFEPTTLKAFRRLALDGASGAEAAEELGLSVSAVYVAKSRVLQRIRQEAEGLID